MVIPPDSKPRSNRSLKRARLKKKKAAAAATAKKLIGILILLLGCCNYGGYPRGVGREDGPVLDRDRPVAAAHAPPKERSVASNRDKKSSRNVRISGDAGAACVMAPDHLRHATAHQAG